MYEMMGYIFGSLKSSEDSVKCIKRTLRAQKTINMGITIFAWASVVNMMVDSYLDRKQNDKIEKLSNEIKELKRMKGK